MYSLLTLLLIHIFWLVKILDIFANYLAIVPLWLTNWFANKAFGSFRPGTRHMMYSISGGVLTLFRIQRVNTYDLQVAP